MSRFEDRVLVIAKQDRQWPRHLRIAHYQLRYRETRGGDREVWDMLLKLNGASPVPQPKGKRRNG